jgi:hypothetical protein
MWQSFATFPTKNILIHSQLCAAKSKRERTIDISWVDYPYKASSTCDVMYCQKRRHYILWWSNLEILVVPLHRSFYFTGGLRRLPIQMEHSLYILYHKEPEIHVRSLVVPQSLTSSSFSISTSATFRVQAGKQTKDRKLVNIGSISLSQWKRANIQIKVHMKDCLKKKVHKRTRDLNITVLLKKQINKLNTF